MFRETRVQPTPTPLPKLLGATVTTDLPEMAGAEVERLVSVKPAMQKGVIFKYQRQAGEDEMCRAPRDKKIAGDIFVNADNARAFARAILEIVGE